MKITVSDLGKRFNRDWIFRHLTYTFEQGASYAITGSNGSGKSTLLQILSGNMLFNEGKCEWMIREQAVSAETIYKQVAICAPYLEVIEEMTLTELLHFHARFKPFLPALTVEKIVSILGLQKAAHKQIRYFSSGMKQRVKLAQCIFSDTLLILLDEPCTNLDATGIEQYHSLINDYCKDRLVIVSSNDEIEYRFCQQRIDIRDFN